jgi:hypothetical protein
MTIAVSSGAGLPVRPLRRTLVMTMTALLLTNAAHAEDSGKKACMPDAKRLCSAEMNTLSRSKVRACLIAHMEQTSPPCHDFMVKARAQAMSGHAAESPPQ